MKFKRAVQRYGRTPEPVTPFQRAGQVWDDRIGSARVQARNWRLMAFGSLILSGGLACGLAWQSLQSRVVPYVVEVDRLGEAQAVSPAARDFRPTDPQIAWHLGQFIRDVRSLSLDPVLMRQGWLRAYDFASAKGAIFLSEYARSSDPFARAERENVSVQIISVVRASDHSFQVKWIESAFEHGSPAGTSRWTAILTIVQKPPANAEALRKNPLGLFVDAVDWSEELEPADAGSAIRARQSPEPLPAAIGPQPSLHQPTSPTGAKRGN